MLTCCGLASGCEKTPVDELAASLSDIDHEVRYDAAKKLEGLRSGGHRSGRGVGDRRLSDPDPKVRYRSAKALSKVGIGATPAASQIQAALKDAPSETRYYLVKTLANIEDAAVIAVNDLEQVLKAESDSRTRYYAAKAFGKIGKQAAPAAEVVGGGPERW